MIFVCRGEGESKKKKSFLVRVERQPFFLCACAFLRADLPCAIFPRIYISHKLFSS